MRTDEERARLAPAQWTAPAPQGDSDEEKAQRALLERPRVSIRARIAFVLLPSYFRGELPTAYALLERRFGAADRHLREAGFRLPS